MTASRVSDLCFRLCLGFIVPAMIVVAIVLLMISFFSVMQFGNPLASIATVVISFPLFIAIHELGHFIAARAMGLSVEEVRIGNLRFHFGTDGKYSHLDFQGNDAGGHVRAVTPTGPTAFRRWVVFVLGGPLASLITTAMLFGVAWLLNKREPNPERVHLLFDDFARFLAKVDNFVISPHTMSVALVNLSAATNLLLLACNFVFLNDVTTDGSILQQLFRIPNPEMMFAQIAGTRERVKTRPREWDERVFALFDSMRSDPAYGGQPIMLEYYRHVDLGRIDAAAESLAAALAFVGDRELDPGTCYEACFFHSRFRSDLVTARAFYDRAGGKPGTEPQTQLRAEAALLLLEGKFDEARDRAWNAIVAMRDCTDSGGAIAEREWIASIAFDAESRRADAIEHGRF